MNRAGQLADWWDERKKESQEILDDWVKSSSTNGEPDYFAITVATAATTSMELGSGFVDALRIGQGVQEGGWGYGKDGLRLLVFAGPAIRGGRIAVMKLASNPKGGICTWVSATQALRQTGTKHFATVDDLAKAAGLQRSALGGTSLANIQKVYQALGAKAEMINGITSLKDIFRLANKHTGNVIHFAVAWKRNGKWVAHSLYAYRNTLGRVVLVDRSGRTFRSLDAIDDLYKGIKDAQISPNALNIPLATIVKTANNASVVALEVNSVLLRSKEQADELFETAKERRGISTGASEPGVMDFSDTPGIAARHIVMRGETLSAISRRYYGTPSRWREIYRDNRDVLVNGPDLIKPGMQLWITGIVGAH